MFRAGKTIVSRLRIAADGLQELFTVLFKNKTKLNRNQSDHFPVKIVTNHCSAAPAILSPDGVREFYKTSYTFYITKKKV